MVPHIFFFGFFNSADGGGGGAGNVPATCDIPRRRLPEDSSYTTRNETEQSYPRRADEAK